MIQKSIQLIFFLGICLVTFIFSARFASQTFHYFRLSEKAAAHISLWEVMEMKGKYALKAHYTYRVQENIWQGSFVLESPYFLNEIAAVSALKKRAKEDWFAWHSLRNPSVSALQKSFPFSLFFRMLICWGILLYFCVLKKKLAGQRIIDIS